MVGMLWTECKQMYMAGLRVYLLDSYNWIDFIVLSLYLNKRSTFYRKTKMGVVVVTRRNL